MARKKRKRSSNVQPMIFDVWNYKVLAVGLLLIIAGFTAMYWENEVEGFISLFISPVVIMAGYITVIIAILKHSSSSNTHPDQA